MVTGIIEIHICRRYAWVVGKLAMMGRTVMSAGGTWAGGFPLGKPLDEIYGGFLWGKIIGKSWENRALLPSKSQLTMVYGRYFTNEYSWGS